MFEIQVVNEGYERYEANKQDGYNRRNPEQQVVFSLLFHKLY